MKNSENKTDKECMNLLSIIFDNKMKNELDEIYYREFEEAKYKPLTAIVRAYKEVYGVLPEGHPQKEFE